MSVYKRGDFFVLLSLFPESLKLMRREREGIPGLFGMGSPLGRTGEIVIPCRRIL